MNKEKLISVYELLALAGEAILEVYKGDNFLLVANNSLCKTYVGLSESTLLIIVHLLIRNENYQKMKQVLFIMLISVFAFTACKTTKQTAQSPYTIDPSTLPKVFSVPVSDTDTETVVKETAKVAEEKPIAIRKEQVSFTDQADRVQNETNTYFVIIGSFSQLENAKNNRVTLLNEGFTPIILHSETGNYRVCVNSYKNELEARGRVTEIRHAFPNYSDIWLLIKE